MVEIRVECGRYGIPPYGKKRDLQKQLIEAYIKRTQEKLYEVSQALYS
jgi:hypothetical protein